MPIIAFGEGEIESIIKSSGCGYVTKASNIDGFIRNLITFERLENEERFKLGKIARDYYLNKFESKKIFSRISELLT